MINYDWAVKLPGQKLRGAGKGIGRKDDYEIISASSMEDLFKRLEDRSFALRSDAVMTEAETYVGGSIDFKL